MTWDQIFKGTLDDCFLVHAFGAHKMITMQGLAGLSSEPNRKPYIDLAQFPEQIRRRDALSCSLIKLDKHTETWGPAGIVLRVPPEDIVATSMSDMGTIDSAKKLRSKSLPIYTVDELLSLAGSYNEIVIDPSHAEISAFFIIEDYDGEPVNKGLAKIARAHASRLGKPILSVKKFDRF